MIELAKEKNEYIRKDVSKKDAVAYFQEKGDEYKLELIDERIMQLQLIRQALTDIANRCDGNDNSAEDCLILKALENAVSSQDETA